MVILSLQRVKFNIDMLKSIEETIIFHNKTMIPCINDR